MSRSIYSLVLDDDIVNLIDRAANKSGRSRSAVVNDILAREFKYETAEMRSRTLLDFMQARLRQHDDFGVFLQDSTLMLRSVLSYKYNPTVRYSLEIHDDYCLLRVVVRSKSVHFIETYDMFISIWAEQESRHDRAKLWSYSDGRFTRRLCRTQGDADICSQAISAYVQAFDGALKRFFCSENMDVGREAVEEIYSRYIDTYGNVLI